MMKIEIIGHRGFASIAPENTLISFDKALVAGAHSVEFDLQLSRDGVPIIYHDEKGDRLCGINDKISTKTISELKTLDVGKWFSPEFAGQQIPTLAEALAIFQLFPQYLYFDVKPHCQWSDRDIANLLRILAQFGVMEKSIIYSFNEDFIEQVRKHNQPVLLAHIAANFTSYEKALKKAIAKGDKIIVSEYHLLFDTQGNPSNGSDLIKMTRDAGIDIVAWTVDDPQDWQKLVNLGITRIVTNALIGRD